MELAISILLGIFGISGITFYGFYCRVKDGLIIDIKNIIEDCRKLSSWDDRSEIKLYSWLNGDERYLHKKKLKDLHSTRNSMIKYFQVHLEMQENEPYGNFQSSPQKFKDFILNELLHIHPK